MDQEKKKRAIGFVYEISSQEPESFFVLAWRLWLWQRRHS
jgi:hypothetical protein